MTNLRMYFRQLGGHVHVRVFSGKHVTLTHAKNGDLTFSKDEWEDVRALLVRIAEVRADEQEPK